MTAGGSRQGRFRPNHKFAGSKDTILGDREEAEIYHVILALCAKPTSTLSNRSLHRRNLQTLLFAKFSQSLLCQALPEHLLNHQFLPGLSIPDSDSDASGDITANRTRQNYSS